MLNMLCFTSSFQEVVMSTTMFSFPEVTILSELLPENKKQQRDDDELKGRPITVEQGWDKYDVCHS